jgi:hypothetical protein
LGRFTLDEIANSLGRVTVTAAELGVSLDEVLAGLASLTVTGVPADEAMTLLSNTMRGLLKPTKAMKAAFAELGVANAEAGIKAFGLFGFLDKIRDTSGGTASELAQLTENVRVARGVLGVTGEQADRTAENLRKISEASADFLTLKNDIILNTNAKQVQIELEQIKTILLVDIGQNGLAAINSLTAPIGGLSTLFTAAAASAALLVTAFIALKVQGLLAATTFASVTTVLGGTTIAINGVTISVQGLQLAMTRLANIGTLTVAALVAGIVTVGNLSSTIEGAVNDAADKVAKGIQTETQAAAASAKVIGNAKQLAVDEQIRALQKYLIEAQRVYGGERDAAFKSQNDIQSFYATQLSSRIKSYEQYVEKVRAAEKEAADAAIKANENIDAAIFASQNNRFSRDISKLGPEKQISRQIEEVNRLLNESRGLRADGTKESEKLTDAQREQAQQLANQAADSAAQLGNTRLRKQAEEAVNNVIKAQITNELALARQKKEAAALAKANAAKTEADLAEIKNLEEQLQKVRSDALGDSGKSDSERVQLLKDATGLADQLEKKLSAAGNVDLAKALGIQNLISDIRRPLIDALGKDIPIKLAFEGALESLEAQLNSRELSVKVKLIAGPLSEAGIDAEGILRGGGGAAELQNKTTELADTIRKGIEASKEIPVLQGALREQENNIARSVTNIKFELDALVDDVDTDSNFIAQALQRASSAFTVTVPSAFGIETTDRIGAFKEAVASLDVELSKALTNIRNGSLEGVPQFTNALQQLAIQARNAGNANLAKQYEALSTSISVAAEKQVALNAKLAEQQKAAGAESAAQKTAEALKNQATNTDSASTATGDLNTKSKENVGLSQAQAGSTAAVAAQANIAATGLRNQAAAQRELNAAQGGSGGGAAPAGGVSNTAGGQIINNPFFKSKGGPIYRAAGGPTGFAPRGTDTIPAMLSPGEFVVNARSSRKFFSQLMAINAGRMPTYRANGGAVSNTTIGDVNVNVNTSDPSQIDGRMLANALRRELRRGTINLKG